MSFRARSYKSSKTYDKSSKTYDANVAYLLEEADAGSVKGAFALGKFIGRLGKNAPETDETSLTVLLQAQAEAFGEHTFTDARITAKVKETGHFCSARGAVKVKAAADGDAAFAFADAFAEISGADVIFIQRVCKTGSNFEFETLRFVAFDFDFMDRSDDPLIIESTRSKTVRGKMDVAPGNVATASFDVEAVSDTSFVQVTVDTLAVEDTASLTYLSALAAVG